MREELAASDLKKQSHRPGAAWPAVVIVARKKQSETFRSGAAWPWVADAKKQATALVQRCLPVVIAARKNKASTGAELPAVVIVARKNEAKPLRSEAACPRVTT